MSSIIIGTKVSCLFKTVKHNIPLYFYAEYLSKSSLKQFEKHNVPLLHSSGVSKVDKRGSSRMVG